MKSCGAWHNIRHPGCPLSSVCGSREVLLGSFTLLTRSARSASARVRSSTRLPPSSSSSSCGWRVRSSSKPARTSVLANASVVALRNLPLMAASVSPADACNARASAAMRSACTSKRSPAGETRSPARVRRIQLRIPPQPRPIPTQDRCAPAAIGCARSQSAPLEGRCVGKDRPSRARAADRPAYTTHIGACREILRLKDGVPSDESRYVSGLNPASSSPRVALVVDD